MDHAYVRGLDLDLVRRISGMTIVNGTRAPGVGSPLASLRVGSSPRRVPMTTRAPRDQFLCDATRRGLKAVPAR